MQTKTPQGFIVEAGKDRFNEQISFLEGTFECKVSSNDSREGFCVFNTMKIEKGGPFYHFHYTQDEWFYILEGGFVFKIGDDIFKAKAGDSVFAPRLIPHAFTKVSEENARMLIMYQPAGTIEDFYLQASQLKNGTMRDFEKLYRIHGMEIVGPPL
jgi:mannose-6-phosphate isomerase-like protein (cupin superfamily)